MVGREALLTGLAGKPHLNGWRVTIGKYKSEGEAKGRYIIRVAGEKLALRRANLRLVPVPGHESEQDSEGTEADSDSEDLLEQACRAHGVAAPVPRVSRGGGGGGGGSSGGGGDGGGEGSSGGGGGGVRRCRLVLGSGLASRPRFGAFLDEFWPAGWSREAASAPPGTWLQIWTSQGALSSALHAVHVSSAEALVGSLRHCVDNLSPRERASLQAVVARPEEREAHPLLLDTARAAAQHLARSLPAPSDPLPLRPGGRRRCSRLLVVVGMEKIRNGHAGLKKESPLLQQVAWPLARATLLALQLAPGPEGGEGFSVLSAREESHVHGIVRGLVRACHRRALLGLREGQPQ